MAGKPRRVKKRRTSGRHPAWRAVRRTASIGALILVVEYLVVPQLAGARRALHLLTRVNVGFVGLALLLEGAALLAYAELTRSVLPRKNRLSLSRILRIDLATLAITHVVPGGSAAGAALGYRLLDEAGVDGPDAGFALATQGLGSAVVLNVLLWLGLVVSIPIRGFNPLYAIAAIVGAVLLGFFGFAVLALTRGEDHAARLVCRVAKRVRFLDDRKLDDGVHRLADRIDDLARDRQLLAHAAGWAAANWLLDAASLWVFLLAFGHFVGPDGLLVSYGLANVLAAIPVTPAGLGVTETILVATLVGFGSPRGVAVLAVLAYRLVNFWLPIPVGAGAYLSLRGVARDERRRAAAISAVAEIAEKAAEEAERARDWAERKGIVLPHTRST